MRSEERQAYPAGMRTASRALATVVVVVGMVALAPTADAARKPVNEGGDRRPCVTYDEYEAVFIGTPMRKVRRVFDTNGTRVHSSDTLAGIADTYNGTHDRGNVLRIYTPCEAGIQVVFEFDSRSPRLRVVGAYMGF